MLIKIIHKTISEQLVFQFCQGTNLYDTLNIPHNATFAQIKQQFVSKSKQLHPDQSPESAD